MSTTDIEGGPGRKGCPCGVFVAARTGTCPKCGHIFVSRVAALSTANREPRTSTPTSPSPVEVDSEERAPTGRRPVLLVPSGRCPVELEGTDRGAVQEWAFLLCSEFSGYVISRFAAMQFVRQFYPMGSPEFVVARSHLSHCRSLHPDAEFRA